MSIARRDVFRGLGFAALVGKFAEGRRQYAGGYPLAAPDWKSASVERGAAGLNQVMSSAQSAAYKLAEAAAARDHQLLDRRQRNLGRLKSVSQAFIEAQCEAIDRERNSIWTRLNEQLTETF